MSVVRRLVLSAVLFGLLLALPWGVGLGPAGALAADIPVIASIAPTIGPAAGGTTVVITGTGFTGLAGPSAVSFGGDDAASYSVDSATQITAISPPHLPATVDIVVTADGGPSTPSSVDLFTYERAPAVGAVSPTSGSTRGGDTVVITGYGFGDLSGPSAVTFGGTNATSYTVNALWQITVVVPPHPAGTVDVVVNGLGGASTISLADQFTYVTPPAVTAISPASGPTNGATSVLITGTDLSGATAVTFGDSPAATYSIDSAYQITAVSPAHIAGTVDLTVTTAGGSSTRGPADCFTYLAAPANRYEESDPRLYYPSAWPTDLDNSDSGGAYKHAAANGASVTIAFNGVSLSWIARTGPDMGAAAISVDGGAAVNVDLYSASTRYQQPVFATGALASGLHTVEISYTGIMNASATADTINIDAVEIVGTLTAFTRAEQTDLQLLYVGTWSTFASPEASGGSYKRATWSQSSPPFPSVTITFNGQRLDWIATVGSIMRPADVSVDGAPIVPVNLRGNLAYQQKVFSTGILPSGYHVVRISWPGFQVSGSYINIDAVDVVGTLVPNAGDQINPAIVKEGTWSDCAATGAYNGSYGRSSTGGASATVYFTGTKIAWLGMKGSNAGVVDVYLDDVKQATLDLYTSSEQYQTALWASDSLASGTHHMDLIRNSNSLSTEYVVLDAVDVWGTIKAPPIPTVTSLNPTFGSTAGDTSVVITGTNLTGATSVTFGGSAATITANTATSITVTSPSHAAGKVDVQVTTAGGASSTSDTGDDFAYNAIVSPTRYEQTDPRITYSAVGWAPYPAPPATGPASGGNYARSSTPGASATVWFTGTKIAWIGMKGTTPGIVDVYLDDVWKAKLDLVASSATYQLPLWTSAPLPNTLHHLDLVRNKDSLSTEFIVLDAIDIWGTIQTAPPAITSLSPASGLPAGGTSVTIGGTSLSGATSVTFGGTPVVFTVNSSTKITATAPAHAVGPVPVQVTTSAGTASSTFTYAVALPTTRLDVVKTTTVTTPGTIWGGTWAPYTSASAYKGTYMRSSTAGAYVLIAFKGTRLDWITMKGTTGGIADIYLDGSSTKAASINLYVSSPIYQRNLWSTGPLADGYHTVKIVRAPGSVSGRYLTIDAVEVAGTLLAPTRIEEKASPSPFTWNPAFTSWTTGTITSASGGTYKYINTPGAYVSFRFTGVGFQIIARTAPSYGNLTVTVDGVSQTVSLYSSVTTYKKIVFTKFTKPGTHTVKISRAGTKSTSSTGYTIDLDAIDLFGVPG